MARNFIVNSPGSPYEPVHDVFNFFILLFTFIHWIDDDDQDQYELVPRGWGHFSIIADVFFVTITLLFYTPGSSQNVIKRDLIVVDPDLQEKVAVWGYSGCEINSFPPSLSFIFF